MNITKTEQLMLDVMAELALAEEPIVFKGAMTLKLAVDGKTQTDICRTTRDMTGTGCGRMRRWKRCAVP